MYPSVRHSYDHNTVSYILVFPGLTLKYTLPNHCPVSSLFLTTRPSKIMRQDLVVANKLIIVSYAGISHIQ